MSWLLMRDEIPFRSALSQYFERAGLSRLCDCGCNSFELEVSEDSDLPPLCSRGQQGGMFFELNFALPDGHVLEFLFFCDRSGKLKGVDVEVSGNNFPVPETPSIGTTVKTWASPSLLPVS
jgi:hypothetical protein